jgi:hypothetical protein
MSATKSPAPGATGSRGRYSLSAEQRQNTSIESARARTSEPVTATIRKNALEEIRVGLSEFNGHDLLNIRVWAEPRDGGTDRIPTKAGIACNVRLLPELIAALRQAEADARAQGLLS